MPTARPAAPAVSPAVAARVRQLAAQAEHRHAIAEFRARYTADQQARIDALLLEAIAALASLFSQAESATTQPDHLAHTRPRQRRRHHQELP